MSREIISANDGMVTEIVFDPSNKNKFGIKYTEDIAPALEQNVRLYNNPEYKKQGIKRSFQHVAHIPPVLIQILKSEYGLDIFNQDHLAGIHRLLRDPEFRKVRVTAGAF